MKTSLIPRRPYGSTGIDLSIVGFGGIVVMNTEPADAAHIVGQAVERGVNYFDVAPSYGDAEIKLGPALEPYRQDVFLACKSTVRSRDGATVEFEETLRRMRTDYVDLYQLHAITSVEEDVECAFADDGVMQMALEFQREGRIRYLGVSAHSVEAAAVALERHSFDSVLFPLNFAASLKNGFGLDILENAKSCGAARLALKAMACQRWTEKHPYRDRYRKCWYEPLREPEMAELALRWSLSHDITAILPPGELELFLMALDFAERYRPIEESELEILKSSLPNLTPIFPLT